MRQSLAVPILFRCLPIIERTAFFALLVGVILHICGITGTVTMAVPLIVLSCIFFLNAFRPLKLPPAERGRKSGLREMFLFVATTKFSGVASGIATLGITFYLQNWEGTYELLSMGIIGLLPAIFLLSYGLATSPEKKEAVGPALYKSGTVAVLAIYLILKTEM